MLLALTLSLARGADCPNVDLDDWRDALDATDEAFTEARLPDARRLLAGTVQVLPCLKVVVPTDLLGRYARQRAFLYSVDQEGIEALGWYNLARVVDPEGAWPAYVPGRHSARDLSREPAPIRGSMEGQGLLVPDGGGVFLDGRYLFEPVAEAEVPHILQVADGEGVVTWAGWQQGVLFPDNVLGPVITVPPAPLWFTDPVDPAVARAEKRKVRFRAAAGFGAMAAGLFGGAHLARASYEQYPTDTMRGVVNGATVGSGVAATAGLVAATLGVVAR